MLMWKDAKYLLAYSIPAVVFHALYYRGIWSYNAVIVAFVLVPILEFFFTGTTDNLTEEEEATQASKQFFSFLLYANAPLLLAITYWYFFILAHIPLENYELTGLSLSMGIYLGGVGINVAHELGHRSEGLATFLAKVLLMPNLYMHFIIEHNHGHHVHIATPKDPATSRLNEPIYTFYIRSISQSFLSAWQIEAQRLQQRNQATWSIYNQMIQFQIIQISYLTGVVWLFGWAVLPFALLCALLGVLMLETVNYIEHYGLQRRQLASGRYEPVQPWHSWNCNHDIGRILLYELTRHSDHHYKSTRQYQILRHFDQAPLLPWGYPTAMLIALCPPLWFYCMNPKVAQHSPS